MIIFYFVLEQRSIGNGLIILPVSTTGCLCVDV